MARPKRQFSDEDERKMFDYALSGCQNGTIARLMCISPTTLIRRYGNLLSEKRAERKFILRDNQTKLSKTNPAMAIFLGKNELGQEDKQTVKTEATGLQMTEAEQKASEAAAKIYKLRLAE